MSEEVLKWDGSPRQMWVWNEDVNDKQVAFVIYVRQHCKEHLIYYPVITLDDHENVITFKHCAEMKSAMLTHRQLAVWLSKKPGREFKISTGDEDDTVMSSHTYYENEQNDSLSENYMVRDPKTYGWRKATYELLKED